MLSAQIQVVNPFTGETIGAVPAGTAEDIDRAVGEAAEGVAAMRAMPLHRRAHHLSSMAH